MLVELMIMYLSLDASFITALMRLLLDAPSSVESQQHFPTFAGHIVTDVIVPNLVWKGGRYTHIHVLYHKCWGGRTNTHFVYWFIFSRTAAAIRTACMTCLQIMLQENMLSTDTLNGVHSSLIPQVLMLMLSGVTL